MARNVNELSKPKPAEGDEPEGGGLPTKDVVTKLTSTVQNLDKKMQTIRGEKGAAIKSASDEKNVHKKAFKQAMSELNMDAEERTNYQRHLAQYRRDLGIELQGDLFRDDEVAAKSDKKKSDGPAATNLSGVGGSAAPAH